MKSLKSIPLREELWSQPSPMRPSWPVDGRSALTTVALSYASRGERHSPLTSNRGMYACHGAARIMHRGGTRMMLGQEVYCYDPSHMLVYFEFHVQVASR